MDEIAPKEDQRVISVHVMQDRGYIWDPHGMLKSAYSLPTFRQCILHYFMKLVDAYWVRDQHGIIGAIVGGVPGAYSNTPFLSVMVSSY